MLGIVVLQWKNRFKKQLVSLKLSKIATFRNNIPSRLRYFETQFSKVIGLFIFTASKREMCCVFKNFVMSSSCANLYFLGKSVS